jgi:hypothetical protein
MNIATHCVEVPFPQAFASLLRSPFPCAPRYGRNKVPRVRLAARRECARVLDFTLALPLLLEKHGSIFTHCPTQWNPPKRSSVLKVLEQVYYRSLSMSSVLAWEGVSPHPSPRKGARFILGIGAGWYEYHGCDYRRMY